MAVACCIKTELPSRHHSVETWPLLGAWRPGRGGSSMKREELNNG